MTLFMTRDFTTAASCCHSDDFDGVRLEEVDPPPRTRLTLGFCASLPVMFRAEVAVVAMICIAASHGSRLIRRLAETDVCTCRNICFVAISPKR